MVTGNHCDFTKIIKTITDSILNQKKILFSSKNVVIYIYLLKKLPYLIQLSTFL